MSARVAGGNIHDVTAQRFFSLESTSDTGNTWTTITPPLSESFIETFNITGDDKMYIMHVTASAFFVQRSLDFGQTWQTIDSSPDRYNRPTGQPSRAGLGGFAFSGTSVYYSFVSASNIHTCLRYSPTGTSGTFIDADTSSSFAFHNDLLYNNVTVAPNGKAYYATGNGVRSGTTSSTFGNVDFTASSYNVFSNISGNIYVGASIGGTDTLKKSTTGASGTFINISTGILSPIADLIFIYDKDLIYGANPLFQNGVYSSIIQSSSFAKINDNATSNLAYDRIRDVVYITQANNGSSNCKLIMAKLISNSASLSPIFFGTSYGYAIVEPTSINYNLEKFNLANVSEFPHSNGIFQMKNLILGTQSSGKVGKSDDSIIQVKHIGSTVKIMWPRQENADSTLFGYGDLSVGQSVGKLTSIFDPGDFIEVTEFDHMSLYCYLQKRSSGTLDDIVIQVERKPIRDIGFSTDQAISYSTSGSVVEARLQDINYVKEINYGDLSLREIAWPIDIPLTNTKQVRISCKFKNGQNEDQNKNFIVYGRFIRSSNDTRET